MSHRLALVVPLLISLSLGCGASSIRTRLSPLAGAVVDTLDLAAAAVIELVDSVITAGGIEIKVVSPAEGYLETQWFDTLTETPVDSGNDSDAVVRMRFWADPVRAGVQAQLISEVVYLQRIDPSLPERELETLAPPGHPGYALLQEIVEQIENPHAPLDSL